MDKKLSKVGELITSGGEGAILGKLWRLIIKDLGFLDHLTFFVNRYVTKTGGINNRVKNARRKTKSSIITNITDEELTWKVFLDLLYNVLNVRKFTLSIKLEHANGKNTIHHLLVVKPESMEEEKDENVKQK